MPRPVSKTHLNIIPEIKKIFTILCFCPPLSLDPLLPTIVSSPAGIVLKSESSAHALTTVRYHSASKARHLFSPTMFSRIVELVSHGVCSQKARSGYFIKASPSSTEVSFARPLRNVDLPLPTGPMIATKEPVGNGDKSSVILVPWDEDVFQPK